VSRFVRKRVSLTDSGRGARNQGRFAAIQVTAEKTINRKVGEFDMRDPSTSGDNPEIRRRALRRPLRSEGDARGGR
jgi:hypothetical protein